mgnify:CR=1 FL=1
MRCRINNDEWHDVGKIYFVHSLKSQPNSTGVTLNLEDEDGKYFNMEPSELNAAGLDFWLLGHIHVAYPTQEIVNDNPVYFMSGTHMPDSWKSTNMGNAWVIEVDD